jgi:hypothetical protein
VQTSAQAPVGPEGAGLQAQVRALQAAAAGHKRAIRQHRERLASTMEALKELEARCRVLGIRLIVQE